MHLVWKRRKDLLYVGSVHGGELPEIYGLTGDHVATDAFGMRIFSSPPQHRLLRMTPPVNFINHQNPNHPSGSIATSPLSNISWPKYTLDSKKIFLFSDDASEEYATIPDIYRADAIDVINEIQTGLEV